MVAMHQEPPAPHQSFVPEQSSGSTSTAGSSAGGMGRRASDGDVSATSSSSKHETAQHDWLQEQRDPHRQTSNSTAKARLPPSDLPDLSGLTMEQAQRHMEARHATHPQLSKSRQGHTEAPARAGRLTFPYGPDPHAPDYAPDMERANTLQQPKPLLPNPGISQMPLPADMLAAPEVAGQKEQTRPAEGPGLVPYPQYQPYDANIGALYGAGSAYPPSDSARASASSISPVSGKAYNAQASHYSIQGQANMVRYPAMAYSGQMYGHPSMTPSDQYGSSHESPSPNSYEYAQQHPGQTHIGYATTSGMQGHFVYVNPEVQSVYNPNIGHQGSSAYSGPSTPVSSPPVADMSMYGHGGPAGYYESRNDAYWQQGPSPSRGAHGGMAGYYANRGRGRGGPDHNVVFGSMHAAMGHADYGNNRSSSGYPSDYSPGPQPSTHFSSSGRNSAYSGSAPSNHWQSPNMGYPPDFATPRSSFGGSYIGSPLQYQPEWAYASGWNGSQQFDPNSMRGRGPSGGERGRPSVSSQRRDGAGGWYAPDHSSANGDPAGLRHGNMGISPRQTTKALGSVGLGIKPGAGPGGEHALASTAKPVQRKEYHPQAPANRSDWVMWVGNVPGNVTHEEMWQFFNSPLDLDELASDARPATPCLGIASIFLISRSSCGFVNLKSALDLHVAIAYFNGRSLRPWDPQCPKLVCRIRKSEDDLKAGVGAQRGSGMHSRYIRELKLQQAQPLLKVDVDIAKRGPTHTPDASTGSIPPSPAAVQGPPSAPGVGISPAAYAAWHHDRSVSGSHSFASTNSSFLQRHFPKRFFILKSSTQEELEHSFESGTWRTQAHNEPILDQAFRTSPEVFLIFGANRQGCFYGYAIMRSAIREAPTRERHSVSWSSKLGDSSGSSGTRSSISKSAASPGLASVSIVEQDETPDKVADEADNGDGPASEEVPGEQKSKSGRPKFLHTPSSNSDWRLASSSPREMSPGDELKYPRLSPMSPATHARNTEPGRIKDAEVTPMDDSHRTNTLDPKLLSQQERHRMFVSAPGGEDFELDEAAPERAKRGHGLASPPADEPVATTHADGVTRKDMAAGGGYSPLDAVPEGEQLDVTAPLPQSGPVEDASGPASLGGTAFKIEWVKVGQLPFARLKHLRNPWNQDKEIKVSRDGTELEPRVAAQLLDEWNRLPSAQTPTAPVEQE